MSIIYEIQKKCIERGITRLCHFTPSRKLSHILAGGKGILSSACLEREEQDIYEPTDIKRLDGQKSHICCSIEYPNLWYYDKVKNKDELFKEWVIILIKPYYLWKEGTKFCNRNASAKCGKYISKDFSGFKDMFNEAIEGSGNRVIKRGSNHLSCCPTDNQAEVLIPDCIGIDDLIGVVVRDDRQANREIGRFELMQIECKFPIYISPDLFDKIKLASCINRGHRPQEIRYNG